MREVKRSTAIAIVAVAVPILVGMWAGAWALWGRAVADAIHVGLLVLFVGACLWIYLRYKYWEYLLYAAGWVLIWCALHLLDWADESLPRTVGNLALELAGLGCLVVAVIGMWRRRRAEKPSQSNHPETTQGA